MYIVADALKNVKLSGDLAKDRLALRDALPKVRWTAPPARSASAAPAQGWQAGRLRCAAGSHRQHAKGGKFVVLK